MVEETSICKWFHSSPGRNKTAGAMSATSSKMFANTTLPLPPPRPETESKNTNTPHSLISVESVLE